MKVAAVVPHWNRRDLLQTLLDSLARQTRPFDEVIVADNGSTDDSASVAESAGARVLRLGSNLGFAAAVNRGAAATDADWIAILNNDVTLDPHWLSDLLGVANATNVDFATGKILRTDNPNIIDGAYDEISRGACALRCGAGCPDSEIWDRARSIHFAPLTAALVRKPLFESLGGLDEAFGSYLEDVDFGIRCAIAGHYGIYLPTAVAWHRGSSSLGTWNPDTVRLIARNQILLASKHFRGMPRWPIVVGQLLWGIVALRHLRGVSYLRGKWSGWKIARARSTSYSAHPESFRAIVAASEREIYALQQQTGFDRYWRAYFWLSRP